MIKLVKQDLSGLTELVTALCLCCRDAVNRVRIRESEGLKTLLNLLNNMEKEYLHERIIISLLAFRFDEPSLNILLDNGFIGTLIKHLNKYIMENKKCHILAPTKIDNLCNSKIKSDNEKFEKNTNSDEDKISHYHEEILPKEVLKDDSNTVKSHKNVARTPEIAEECDSDFDNEVADATANMQKENNSSKVFCINSPSYQEIQNEHYEITAFDRAFDNQLSDICSPCSTGSCFSPDRYSIDWNLPSPPPSYGVWSPAASSRDDLQWSPNSFLSSPKRNTEFIPFSSPSSPSSSSSTSQSPQTVQLLRYSPVCEEHVSEEENENCSESPILSMKTQNVDSNLIIDHNQVSALNATKAELEQKSLVSSHAEKRDISQLYPNNSTDEFIQPILKLSENMKRRRISAASDISGHSSSHKEEKQNYNIGDYILMHLSHFSQMEKPTYKIVTEECIQALLDYTCCISTTARAERILLRLTSNYHCFEYLINFGIMLLIHNKLTIQHDLSICDKCDHLKSLKNKLLKNLSFVAESGYGMGVLCHILLTGLESEQSSCILAIPYLIRRRNLLKRILIDCYGLELLMNLLKTTDSLFKTAVNSLCALCQHFVHLFDIADFNSIENRAKDDKVICKYVLDSDRYDVTFILDNGYCIGARRSQLTKKSSFFEIMLQGSFAESAQESIKLPEVSKEALNIIFHYLYECKNVCFKLNSAPMIILLELMIVSDRLLLKELETHVVKEIIIRLSPENVWNVYLHSKKYNYTELNNAALRYILVGSMEPEERCCAISNLFTLEEAVHHVETFIKDKFPESKDQPLYKRQRSNDVSQS